MERALSVFPRQTNPTVDLTLELLGMARSEQHFDTNLYQYRSKKIMPQMRVDLLASQLNAVVHMLMRTCGEFPLSSIQKHQLAKYADILQRLNYNCPAVHGGILTDYAGMGKMYTFLAFFTWWALNAKHIDIEGKPNHQPSLLLTPDGYLLKPWVDAIKEYFPRIELVVVKSGKKRPIKGAKPRYQYSTANAITECQMPGSLKYVFDKKDSKASRTLFISSYKTWRQRSVVVNEAPQEIQELHEPPEGCVRPKGKELYFGCTTPMWEGKFAMVTADEGHDLRNEETQVHCMVRAPKAPINWMYDSHASDRIRARNREEIEDPVATSRDGASQRTRSGRIRAED